MKKAHVQVIESQIQKDSTGRMFPLPAVKVADFWVSDETIDGLREKAKAGALRVCPSSGLPSVNFVSTADTSVKILVSFRKVIR